MLLTTHYLDEAEQLADRVAVLRAGEIIREGSPAELTEVGTETEIRYRRNGHEVVERTHEPTRRLNELTGGCAETEIRYRQTGHAVVERTNDPTSRLHELTAEAHGRGERLEGLEVRRPTLEEIYLELTE